MVQLGAIAGIANVNGTITDGGPPAARLTGPERLERFAAEVGPGLRAALGA